MKSPRQIKNLSLAATVLVLVALYCTAGFSYQGFFSLPVFANLLGDNAFLGISAIGMTFVILSGGIDLSVGSVLAFTTTLVAKLIMDRSVPPFAAILVGLVIGTIFGGAMGFLIERYDLPAFLVTLGGMFFARGIAFAVSPESIGISHPFY